MRPGSASPQARRRERLHEDSFLRPWSVVVVETAHDFNETFGHPFVDDFAVNQAQPQPEFCPYLVSELSR